MKRGNKDEEKIMGPMFPRLHVNDTAEKGGPRAPPRNKMALYEQLSIPSQRFSSTVIPLDTQHKPSLVSSTSSTQRNSVDRNLLFLRHLHQSTPMSRTEKVCSHESDVADETMMVATQLDQGEKVGGDDNEFRVPVFVKSRAASQCHGKVQHSADRESVSSISSVHVGPPPVEQRNTSDRVTKSSISTNGSFPQEERNESKRNVKAGSQNGSRVVISSSANQSVRENFDGHVREAKESVDQEFIRQDVSSVRRSGEAEACLLQEPGIEVQGGNGLVKSKRDRLECESHCDEDHHRQNKLVSDGKHNLSNSDSRNSLWSERVNKGDGDSLIESRSVLDIAPDDVVGIIGQKHFWKARKAIVNQQRVFAVQVFELHRLVKVQKLIAESPHLLLDNGGFLNKSSFKCSPVNKHPPKKLLPVVSNGKDDFEKPSHKKECSMDNASEKPSLTCLKNDNQSVNNTPHQANPQPVGTTTTDNKASDPWCYHQPPGPQWLVPVMSPSEGLVYKPYLGPGLPGAVYGGGYGPFGSTPAPSNYVNSPYGVQASHHHHHQRTGGFPVISPPVDQTYFPHYGVPYPNMDMSASTGEQGNQFSHGQSGQGNQLVLGASLNMEQQSSCNALKPPNKNRPALQAGKSQACKSSDLQLGSSASSPFEIDNGVEKRDPLPLFPVAPVALEVASQSHVTDQPTRAIKVVPHSRRTATESAARIFRFIQEERKQFN